MSEQQRHHEQLHKPEQRASHERVEKQLGKEINERAAQSHESAQERAEEARKSIEKETAFSKETADAVLTEQVQKDTTEVRWWSSELKEQTLDRTLTSVRKRLSAPERRLSKFIHIRAVEDVSEVAGKTVARPSGILVGSIFAFLGSLLSYLIARRIGGELPASVGIMFFVGGFAIGIIGEALVYAFRRMRMQRIKS